MVKSLEGCLAKLICRAYGFVEISKNRNDLSVYKVNFMAYLSSYTQISNKKA